MCVGQRGWGHGRIKAHGTQCSEENAGKYDRNDSSVLQYNSSAMVQLRATNAASMKAQWARAAPALHTHRFFWGAVVA